MKKDAEALALHAKGGNCAQSVLCAFSNELGCNETSALRIATGFGGGMGRTGSTCGAATGAFMVLGLAHGMRHAGDADAKEATYALVRDFSQRFTRKHGTLLCKELLGVDLMTPEGQKTARERDLFATRCVMYISDAAQILEDMLGK